jgi:hypothetical protein
MSDIQNPMPGAQHISDMSEHRPRGTRTGELAVSFAHGLYLEAARTGNMWMVATPVAGITVTANMLYSVASSNAIVGLYNPTADYLAHVTRLTVATATATVCNLVWAVNTPVLIATTPTGFQARNLRTFAEGGHKMIAFNGAQAVSGAGVTEYFRQVLALPTGSGRVQWVDEHVDIVVPPYGFLGLYGDTATTATVIHAWMSWEDVKA